VIHLLGLAVKLAVVAAVGVGAFVAAAYMTHHWEGWKAADPGLGVKIQTIDYNCAQPGCGAPWLWTVPRGGWLCDENGFVMIGSKVVGCVPGESYVEPGWFEIEPCDDSREPWECFMDLYLPVAVDDHGRPQSWDDVYRAVCSLYPELGGDRGVLWPMTEDDRDTYEVGGADWYVGSDQAPNGGPDIYQLPRLTKSTIDWMNRSSAAVCGDPGASPPAVARSSPSPTARPTAKPTPPVDKQRWRISISGYELQELDPYWAVTHGRFFGGVSFDWDLQAEFVLRKEQGTWAFESGAVTYASVDPKPAYGPPGAWEIDLPLRCATCDDLKVGRTLTGEVAGDVVRLSWGRFVPHLTVTGRIALPCMPEPACSKEGQRRYDSERFLSIVSDQRYPLKEGAVESQKWVSPQGLRTLHYTVTLLKLDG
jgi:hypothetical protein